MPFLNESESVVLETNNAAYYGGGLSIMAGVVIVYTYLSAPALRVQPNSILCAKAIFDSLLALLIVIEYIPNPSREDLYRLDRWQDCGGKIIAHNGTVLSVQHTWIATFLTQWFFILSLLCFGVISLDLLINSTNPFVNLRKNNVKYGIGVFFLSLITPTFMVMQIDGKTGSGQVIFLN